MSIRRLHRVFLTLCALALAPVSFGAEAEPASETGTKAEPGPETNAGQTKTAEQDNNNEKDKKDKKEGEIFRPSEEISEDFAVSFPVDI